MIRSLSLLACLALIAALPATASSSASSASSEGSSASVGSLSTSIEGSSNSSSPAGKTAEGPYRVIQVAAAPDRPGRVRVALEAADGGHRIALLLPEATAAAARLAAGDVVVATAREYGVQFARADASEPFFLVVDDRQMPELRTRVLGV